MGASMKIALVALLLASGFGSNPPTPPGIPDPPPPPQCVEACPNAIRILTGMNSEGRQSCQCECWNGLGVATFDDNDFDILNLTITYARICPFLISPN